MIARGDAQPQSIQSEISMTDGLASLVLKIYPQSLLWKMRKEALVSGWLHDRLSAPVPRILLADDTKSVIDLNFVVMSKLEGDVLSRLEPVLTEMELAAAYSQKGRVLRQIHHVNGGLRLHRSERSLDAACEQSRLYVISIRKEADRVYRARGQFSAC
jgi:aminoglycoside phosphotransferase (APT) family kinase protein